MGWQAWFTLAVVALTVVALARELVPPAFALLGATIVLLLAGVTTSEQAFAGFSNEAPITVAALFVLARAAEVTGALDTVVQRVMGTGRAGRRQLARIVASTAVSSAFLNNTPIVAMVAPQVSAWADRRGLPRSRYLMPVSYAAILGGVVTAIGTSTNLVVSGLLVEAGQPPLGMFELTPVGLPIAVTGCALMVLLADRVLPVRKTARDAFAEGAREFTVSMRVTAGGALDGKSVEDAGLRHLHGVYLVQVDRDGRRIAPVAPDEVLGDADVLTFVGRVDDIVDLQRIRGLESTEATHFNRLESQNGHQFFEAVVGAESPLAGRTLKETEFRGRYQAAVVAIHRAGERLDAKLGEVRLEVGDTLLLMADREFRGRWRDRSDFLLIAPLGGATLPAQSRRAPLVALAVAGVVLVAGAGVLPILHASLIAAVFVVAIGALSLREARSAVDLDVLVVIAAAFGIGAAVASSGLADILAEGLLAVFAPLGVAGALFGVLLATMAITEPISNNAAAVLVFPIALSTAAQLGVDPRPFALAVALGASLSFLTPIGYQTNLMVYGPGGYRFSDYARLGAFLNVTAVLLTVALLR